MNNKKIQQITESVVAEVKTLAKEGKTINKIILDKMIKKHLSESKLIKEGAISDIWERFENLKEILGDSELLDAIYMYFGGWKMEEVIDSIETDYDINQEEDDDEDFEDEEIEEGRTYSGADKKDKIKQYQSIKSKGGKMYVGESKKRTIKESIDDFMDNGGTEEEYLDSPEYFEETFINGQFGQLRNMLSKATKTGKLKDILVYLDGNNQGEIIRWIAENKGVNESKELVTETGEWDDNDEEMIGWKEYLKNLMLMVQKATGGKLKLGEVKGFDKYQGPYANVRINGEHKTVWTTGDGGADTVFVEYFPDNAGFNGTVDQLIELINSGAVYQESKKIKK